MESLKKLLVANTQSGRRRVTEVFQDFCELGAIAVRNSVDRFDYARREQRYLAVASQYEQDEVARFARGLATLQIELNREFRDVLGELYIDLSLGNDRLGQFFTPYDISKLSAAMVVGDLADRLRTQPFVTVAEPTCGSGGMIVAVADLARSQDVDFTEHLHVTAQDIDHTAVHMTYLQTSLIKIPARIIHGDTLSLETRDVWSTPQHFIGNWENRLKVRPPAAVPVRH